MSVKVSRKVYLQKDYSHSVYVVLSNGLECWSESEEVIEQKTSFSTPCFLTVSTTCLAASFSSHHTLPAMLINLKLYCVILGA